ncbi:hypothetical protein Pan97_00690 [Bremerella volcania]|uniref:Uncharacterized protein n=1 Tax=Bremerella volcania TaxID=2527984 RepID=A0A518C1J8_9BACT|nr:hypothetical protein [Bremerella volcania]QDU73102.1 hypothetical protein Pan97_00690 [Bremerella volcania]
MRYSRFTCALLAITAVVIYVTRNPAVSAADSNESPDTLQQRVDTLETQVHQLRQLVCALQAERLRDMLPVPQSAIIGEWVAKPDNLQTIVLSFHTNGTVEIAGQDKSIGSVHGTGTWKLNGMQVVCLYQYDGQNDLPQTKLPLDLISKDAMAFAGVVYRRSAPCDPNDVTQAK